MCCSLAADPACLLLLATFRGSGPKTIAHTQQRLSRASKLPPLRRQDDFQGQQPAGNVQGAGRAALQAHLPAARHLGGAASRGGAGGARHRHAGGAGVQPHPGCGGGAGDLATAHTCTAAGCFCHAALLSSLLSVTSSRSSVVVRFNRVYAPQNYSSKLFISHCAGMAT